MRNRDIGLVGRAAFWLFAVLWFVLMAQVSVSGATRYEETALTLASTWTTDSTTLPYSTQASGGQVAYSNTTNDTALRSVTGQASFSVGYCKRPDGGNMAIRVDGATVATVDTYAAVAVCTGQVSGPHTITTASHTVGAMVVGTKNASSTDYYVVVDYVDVEPPAAIPTGPVTQADLYVLSSQVQGLAGFAQVVAALGLVGLYLLVVVTWWRRE